VETRLDFIDGLERRVGNVQSVIADVERRLSAQLHRRSEVESLKVLCDTLLAQLVEAQPRLEEMAALQGRLLPVASQVASLAQALEDSRRALAVLQGRLGEVDRGAGALERKLEAVAGHETLVQSVKAELDHLREVGERSRADLQFVTDREGDLAQLRSKVEGLLTSAEDTDTKIGTIEARRKMVEEAQAAVSGITHLLGDIQIKLELLNEQRVVIEHVGDKVARLDFTVQEAQNTLRALQREREVAERIEQGIKALRARSGAGQPT
jgi:archaellum component FlaC